MKLLHILSLFVGSCHGFTTIGKPSRGVYPSRTTTLLGPVAPDKTVDPLSYAEKRRRLRRDYYTHESWLRHRSKDRFWGTLLKMLDSGVVGVLVQELILVTGVATFIVLYNAFAVVGFDGFHGVHHAPVIDVGFPLPLLSLPLAGFTLSVPALGLLLVFKTTASFDRWDEARKAWEIIVNTSRSVARQSAVWIHEAEHLSADEKVRLLRRIADALWLFARSMQTHLLHPIEEVDSYVRDIRQRLPKQALAELLLGARHKPLLALYELSCAVNQLPLDTFQRTTIESEVTQMCNAMGECDRIFHSPVPVVYTRFAARFVELYMLFVPFALYEPFSGSWNHWAMIPASLVLGFFFLGIEEIAIQLEEPFSVLPLSKIVGGIGLSTEEYVEWMETGISREKILELR